MRCDICGEEHSSEQRVSESFVTTIHAGIGERGSCDRYQIIWQVTCRCGPHEIRKFDDRPRI